MYTAGNHERGGFDRYFRTFNDSAPKHLQTLSFGNFVFYGLNMRSGSRDYTKAVRKLESELDGMKQAGEKNNVFLFFYLRFPNTVKNCHDRPAL